MAVVVVVAAAAAASRPGALSLGNCLRLPEDLGLHVKAKLVVLRWGFAGKLPCRAWLVSHSKWFIHAMDHAVAKALTVSHVTAHSHNNSACPQQKMTFAVLSELSCVVLCCAVLAVLLADLPTTAHAHQG